ncbi:hypothetical protein D0Y65_015870 [Glycine soja]|uniref:DUF223 domain-containing protein n=1 Tax=Glycine soja TaxID=3848 RepID=A0A445KEM5_GLYSO|nr:hypothetical protein D0Y65_015870 [Glycine soja]
MIIHLCRSSGPLGVSWPLLCCLQSVMTVYVVCNTDCDLLLFSIVCFRYSMFRKENLIFELHTKKRTWKIVGAKIGVTLWKKLFVEFEEKLHCGSAYLIQNIKVVDNHSEYKVSTISFLVYLVKTTSMKEAEHSEIPPNVHVITQFVDIIVEVALHDTLVDVVGVVVDVIERKIVNPTYRVTVKLRENIDDEMIMIVWEEYALQLDDAIEKNHFVRKSLVVMLTLANIKDPKGSSTMHDAQKGLQCVAEPWYQYLRDNVFSAGDEICFYFRPNKKVWEQVKMAIDHLFYLDLLKFHGKLRNNIQYLAPLLSQATLHIVKNPVFHECIKHI